MFLFTLVKSMVSRGGFRLCGGGQRAFRSPFGNLRAPAYKLAPFPTLVGRGGSVSRRDHNQAAGNPAHLTGGTNYAEATPPNASRSSGERGLGGEGKDSHSRQWRLSMAVFLNRNKRPQAAPIEVAELLSEKPPLPPASLYPRLFGREREGGCFSTEKHPPSHIIHILIHQTAYWSVRRS